jgi:hypothetical protein
MTGYERSIMWLCEIHGMYDKSHITCPHCYPDTKPTITSAGSSEYKQLLDDMRDLHIRKNAGYAGAGASDPWSNFRQCEQFGIAAVDGVITRMSDKYARIQSLWKDKSNEQVGESIEDTLLDLASYSLILICLLREKHD